MTAILTRDYDTRFRAFESQATRTANLCQTLVDRLLSGNKKWLPEIKGFTFEQYEAARKTLELALKLFSLDDSLQQLQRSRHDITVSQISMKLMWVDVCKSDKRSKEDEIEYHKIYLIADEKLKELNQLIANRAPLSQLSQQ